MKVVIAGDSFTFGQGCEDRAWYLDPKTKKYVGQVRDYRDGPSAYCWASLLQKEYPNINVVNLGQPGIDNVFISTLLLDNMEDADVVIFGGTAINRTQFEADIGKKSPFPIILGNQINQFTSYYSDALAYFLKYLYVESYFMDVSINCVRSVYSACLQRNIKFYWSFPLAGMVGKNLREDDPNVINFRKRTNGMNYCNYPSLMGYSYPQYGDSFINNPYLAVCGHANSLGHEHYYNTHIKPLFEHIMQEKR